eukprot:354691-Chlamydomonas_euryale.AAC.5
MLNSYQPETSSPMQDSHTGKKPGQWLGQCTHTVDGGGAVTKPCELYQMHSRCTMSPLHTSSKGPRQREAVAVHALIQVGVRLQL